ncbi:glycosyltransferase [Xanthomonas sp. MUS 060]|uniref:glycosyltransferase n=1 Tax=Xanthomonas sp. MUS 060 TaxID=1588031 RepID=UPI0005F2CB64|nr:glycosyltransferase [Xanthomonas sp. MUS 060]
MFEHNPARVQAASDDRPIVIATLGTHGDVRPVIALALGLQRRGHPVRVLTSENFAALVEANGLTFFPLSGDHQRMLQRNPIREGQSMLAKSRMFYHHLASWARDWPSQGRAACADARLLIGVGSASIVADALSQALQIPLVYAQLQPVTVSRHLPLVARPQLRLPGPLHVGLQHAIRFSGWQLLRSVVDGSVRLPLGLPAYGWRGPDTSTIRVLYGYSEHLCPRPSDWPARVQICGFWSLPNPQWQPPPALLDFLQAGPPPLYVGFGSMIDADAAQLTATVKAALRLTGQRALLATGWGGLIVDQDGDSDQFFALEHAPHDWLFPRVIAAVHHGGAGTAAAASIAGIPSVVVPFGYDQPFWAHCLAQRGVAPPALRRDGLQPEALAHALRQATSPTMRASAQALGQRLREEDGVTKAVAQLEQWGLLSDVSIVRQHADAVC